MNENIMGKRILKKKIIQNLSLIRWFNSSAVPLVLNLVGVNLGLRTRCTRPPYLGSFSSMASPFILQQIFMMY
jgi:hypothetical protein